MITPLDNLKLKHKKKTRSPKKKEGKKEQKDIVEPLMCFIKYIYPIHIVAIDYKRYLINNI
jgi:hypothetical protein